MQLEAGPGREFSISAALTAAACALIGMPAGAQVAEYLGKGIDVAKDWNLDSALAYYHENGRIQAIEPVVSLSKTFANESVLSLDGVFDTLSGSTPNGALTSNRPQTFTSPSGKAFSGRHTYVTPAGQLPSTRATLISVWRSLQAGNTHLPGNCMQRLGANFLARTTSIR